VTRRNLNQKKNSSTSIDNNQMLPLPAKEDILERLQAKEREEKQLNDRLAQEHERKVNQGIRIPIQKGKDSTYYTEFLSPEEKEQYLEQRANLYAAINKLTEMSGYGRNIVKDVLEHMLKAIRYEEKLRSEHIDYLVSFRTQEKMREMRRKQLRKQRSEDLLSLSCEL
jgi:hypothetical protein